MHHLPHGKAWDPARLADALSRNGVPASANESSIQIEIPDVQSPTIFVRLTRWLFRSRPHVIRIKYDTERFIRNIDVQYDLFKFSDDPPYLHEITAAIRECGYVVKTDREVAANYCPESNELSTLFGRMERLQREKEDLVAAQDFKAASLKLDEEHHVRNKIDAFLFDAVC